MLPPHSYTQAQITSNQNLQLICPSSATGLSQCSKAMAPSHMRVSGQLLTTERTIRYHAVRRWRSHWRSRWRRRCWRRRSRLVRACSKLKRRYPSAAAQTRVEQREDPVSIGRDCFVVESRGREKPAIDNIPPAGAVHDSVCPPMRAAATRDCLKRSALSPGIVAAGREHKSMAAMTLSPPAPDRGRAMDDSARDMLVYFAAYTAEDSRNTDEVQKTLLPVRQHHRRCSVSFLEVSKESLALGREATSAMDSQSSAHWRRTAIVYQDIPREPYGLVYLDNCAVWTIIGAVQNQILVTWRCSQRGVPRRPACNGSCIEHGLAPCIALVTAPKEGKADSFVFTSNAKTPDGPRPRGATRIRPRVKLALGGIEIVSAGPNPFSHNGNIKRRRGPEAVHARASVQFLLWVQASAQIIGKISRRAMLYDPGSAPQASKTVESGSLNDFVKKHGQMQLRWQNRSAADRSAAYSKA